MAILIAYYSRAGENYFGGSYRRITRDDARAILASCVTPVVF